MEALIKKIPIANYGKSKIYLSTFQELIEIKEDLDNPDIQGDLNEDKVEEMINSYNNNQHFLASKCLITISCIEIGNEKQYHLIDGQHRTEMISRLLEEEQNNTILITIITINSQEELKKLFEEINTDSTKCLYKNLSIFDKEIYEKLKNNIKKEERYKSVPDKSSYKSHVYSLSQFIHYLIENQIIEKIRKIHNIEPNVQTIIEFIKQKETIFLNLCRYKELVNEKIQSKKNDFKKDELTQLEKNSCIFIKNNNFFEWLFDENVIPKHDFNYRPPIPPKLRKNVWTKYYNNNSESLCPIIGCQNKMSINKEYSWECGHIKSHFNKGETNLDNLKPLCTSCNRKMSSKDWNEYSEELINKIYLNKFGKKSNTSSTCEKCENKILKKDSRWVKYTDNNIKIWCISCYNKQYKTTEQIVLYD